MGMRLALMVRYAFGLKAAATAEEVIEVRPCTDLKCVRCWHHRPDVADEFVLPPIPDYVDGTFHTDGTGQAPVAQRAA